MGNESRRLRLGRWTKPQAARKRYDFNDASVSAMPQPNDPIVSKEAYVLFYRKRLMEGERVLSDAEHDMEVDCDS
uniref:USP domain-containing protein n=1 Tax=Ascaris lumbricoides TaxID=6252 RepID=A0A0M3HQE7_ASCLU